MTSNDDGGSASETGWSFYSWRSMLPGYGKKPEDDEQKQQQQQPSPTPQQAQNPSAGDDTSEPSPQSHQVTDYEEGERRDIHGNIIHFNSPQKDVDEPRGQRPKDTRPDTTTLSPPLPPTPPPTPVAFIATKNVKVIDSGSTNGSNSNSDTGVSVIKEVSNTVAAVSKTMLKRKNVVLPNYYDQFPNVHKSLITLPIGPTEVLPSNASPILAPAQAVGRFSAFMKSAVDAISSILFSKAAPTPVTIAPAQKVPQGTAGIRKVVIFGIHGWFPTKLVRTVIGEPTGTSKKFCDEMDLALKDYLRLHNVELNPEDITLIPLEGEGKVLDRVNILYNNLVRNPTWRHATQNADLVLVATHSQGTPTSIMLVARLIQEGLLRVDLNDPMMQRIGVLTMAGISHGPFPFLKGNLIVRWFEAEAAGELFEFMDSESTIARRYREGLRVVLSSGVRLTCVASLEDQVVPLYSAVMTSIHHPSIVRAVYIDGASYQNDFLTNLISFALRLRNAGMDDFGVLVHLSEVVAGSLYGEGHSTIYDEREVYMLSIRSLLEPPKSLTPELARSEPVLNPFRAKQRLNPFYLPWGMRGMAEDIKARGDESLAKGLEELQRMYNDWNPVTKGMKEIKYRLEPVRSKL
ncbi:hypothetical protein BG005_003839 [Podila minutissima]|nr:hypothetical protein BG005_003839 [Podila minutissima]